MVVHVVTCPQPGCRSQDVIRFGRTNGGHPRYRCKACRPTFSDAPPREPSADLKARVLAAYEERSSMRGIALVTLA